MLCRLALCVGFAGSLLVAALPASAQITFTVTSTVDPGDGTCNDAECTLREAITAANATTVGQLDRIHFAIPGTGVHTITPLTPLPTITSPVFIDGYTQPGASPNTLAVGNDAVLQIVLDGNGAAFRAIEITAGASTVRGLVINQFDGNGPTDAFQLRTAGGNTIAGNWIGTSADGTTAQNNSRAGIYMESSAANRIGGTSPSDRNVILGAANPVIYDQTSGGSHTIQGNYIGTDAQGLVPLGQTGIYLSSGNNRIGGTEPGAGNVISVTGRDGIFFAESGAGNNDVQGNYIGVGSDGVTPLGFGTSVVIQRGSGNRIGGTTAAERNVLGGSTGVRVSGGGGQASGNFIQGNYIGTNATGTALVLPGGGAGVGVLIESAAGNRVGGTEPGAGNVISGFATGVQFYDSLPGNVVQGNYIGTNAAGMAALPNAEGILLAGFGSDDGNTIGGAAPGAGNVISGNTGDGVRFGRGDDNVFQGNYIGVAADGVTPLGNGGHGIEIGQGNRNTIGGTAPGARNVIAYNGTPASGAGFGIILFTGTGNAIEGNAFYGNGRIPINLVGGDDADGRTANDPGDDDEGPNRLQNTPEISSALLGGGQITLIYHVDTAPANAAYPLRIEFFRADGGQGAALVGEDLYSTIDHGSCGNPPCAKTATFVPTAALSSSDALVATATDSDGNTSEFTALSIPLPVKPGAIAPPATVLHAPAPNPSAGPVTLRYDLATAGHARLVVYDVLGREVGVVFDGERPAGSAEAMLELSGLAPGLYVVRLETDRQVQTRRLTVLR